MPDITVPLFIFLGLVSLSLAFGTFFWMVLMGAAKLRSDADVQLNPDFPAEMRVPLN